MSLKDSKKEKASHSKSATPPASPAKEPPVSRLPNITKKNSKLLEMKEFSVTTTHLPSFTHDRRVSALSAEEKSRKVLRDVQGKVRIVRSQSLTQISSWSALVPPSSARAHIVIDRNNRRRKKSNEKEIAELKMRFNSPANSPVVPRAVVVAVKQNTDDLAWDKVMQKSFVEELEASRKQAKERRASLSGPLPPSIITGSVSPSPSIGLSVPSGGGSGIQTSVSGEVQKTNPSVPLPGGTLTSQPAHMRRPSDAMSPQTSPRLDKSQNTGSNIGRGGEKEGSKIKERLAKDESKQVGTAFPGIRVHTNQESQEDKRAKRLALLTEQGIEIGSFSQGSPLILAGTLEKIVEKLGNWLVSAMRDSTSNLQVNGFLWTYEKFCSHLDLLNVVINLYKQPASLNIPEASREKFLKKKREGVIAFLCTWLSDETLSPKHREFLHEKTFQETLTHFLKHTVSNEYGRHVHLINTFLRDPTHRRAHPKYLLSDDEVAAKYKPKEELFGIFGKRTQNFDDVLEMNVREAAEQLTYLDFDSFLEIDWYEVYHLLWTKSHATAQNCSILQTANRAKQLCGWVATQICETENLSKRAEVCARFIDLADKLYELNNYHSLMQVLSGLNHGAVLRLNKTWAKVSASHSKRRDELTEMMAQFGAYKNYRAKLEKRLQGGEPVVPCLDVILRDFALADENTKFVDEGKQWINFDKCMWMVTYLEDMRKIRSKEYPISYTEETTRERQLRRFLREPKPVRSDEELYTMSQKVEPRVKQM